MDVVQWVRTAQQPQGTVLPNNLIIISVMTLVHPGNLHCPNHLSEYYESCLCSEMPASQQGFVEPIRVLNIEPTVPKNFWEIRGHERSFKASYRGFWQRRRRASNLRELLKFRDVASLLCSGDADESIRTSFRHRSRI